MDLRKIFLLVLLGGFLWLGYLMVEPFLTYIVAAALIAFVIRPLHERVSSKVPPRISALSMVFLSLFLAVVPFLFAANAVINDAGDLAKDIENGTVINSDEVEQRIYNLTGREVNLTRGINDGIDSFLEGSTGRFSEVLSLVTGVTIGLTIMVFAIYYMLLEGESLVKWIRDALPLEPEIEQSLFNDIERTTWAVIKGHVLVAVVQGLVAGIGLFIAGISNYFFWTFVMILLGFIPIIGTFVVWGPASAFLFVSGETSSAIFLAVYGLIIVSLTDNFLRPFAVDRGADIHPAVILIGVIGGVYLFGAIGLFIGPIILGILKSILLAVKKEYEDI